MINLLALRNYGKYGSGTREEGIEKQRHKSALTRHSLYRGFVKQENQHAQFGCDSDKNKENRILFREAYKCRTAWILTSLSRARLIGATGHWIAAQDQSPGAVTTRENEPRERKSNPQKNLSSDREPSANSGLDIETKNFSATGRGRSSRKAKSHPIS